MADHAAANPANQSVPPPPEWNNATELVTPPFFGKTLNGIEIPNCPPQPQGLPPASTEDLMATQKVLIAKIQDMSRLAREDFTSLILPVLKNYAAFVHLLPASEEHHHSGPGGLFCHGLEVAYHSAMICTSRVFAMDSPPSVRRELELRWKICAILGGLLHDIGKPVVDVYAVDPTGKMQWQPHVEFLTDWLKHNQLPFYYVDWHYGERNERHKMFNPVPLWRIIPTETMRWLNDNGGKEAFDAMCQSIAGSTDGRNKLNAIISQADSMSVSQNLATMRQHLTMNGRGGVRSLAARIVRALYDQLREGKWRLNVTGGVLWYTTEGLMAIYPNIAEKVIEVMREAYGEKSLPFDAQIILNVLSDHGYLRNDIQVDGRALSTWRMRVHFDDHGKEKVMMFKQVLLFNRDDVIPAAVIKPTPVFAEILDSQDRVVSTAARAKAMAERNVAGIGATTETTEEPSETKENKPVKKRQAAAPQVEEGDAQAGLFRTDDEDDGDEAVAVPVVADSVQLRDRSTELDVRDELMLSAHAHMNSKWPPETPEEAMAWVRSKPNGIYILGIIEKIESRAIVVGKDVIAVGDYVHLTFPKCLTDLGIPAQDVMRLFESEGWSVRDPATPGRGTVSIKGQGKEKLINAVRMSESMSQVLTMLIPAAQAGEVPQAPKADIPQGPYLSKVKLIDDTTFKKDDSPKIRLAMLAMLGERDPDRGPPDHNELVQQVNRFAKLHRLQINYLMQHLSTNPNAFVISPNEKRPKIDVMLATMVLNPEYDPVKDHNAREIQSA